MAKTRVKVRQISGYGSTTTQVPTSSGPSTDPAWGAGGGGGGGTPGGSTTQVQYNNAGAFAGASNFTITEGPAGTWILSVGNASGANIGKIVLGGSSGLGSIDFNGGPAEIIGADTLDIKSTAGGNGVRFYTNGALRIRISDSGELMLGAGSDPGTAGYRVTSQGPGLPLIWAADVVTPNGSTTVKGVSEESDDTEVVAGTGTGSTGARLFVSPPRLAVFWAAVKTVVNTWTLQQTFSIGMIVADATALTIAYYDASKKLVSIAYAALADYITGADNTKPLTVAGLIAFRNRKPITISVVVGSPNLLTLACAGSEGNKFIVTSAITTDFTINFSGHTDAQDIEVWFQINGASATLNTINVTMTNGTSGQPNIVSQDADVRYVSKVLKLDTVAAKWHRLAFTRLTTGATGVIAMDASTPISIS